MCKKISAMVYSKTLFVSSPYAWHSGGTYFPLPTPRRRGSPVVEQLFLRAVARWVGVHYFERIGAWGNTSSTRWAAVLPRDPSRGHLVHGNGHGRRRGGLEGGERSLGVGARRGLVPTIEGVIDSQCGYVGEIERAGRILDTFSVQLDQNGEGMGSLVTACLDYLRVAPPRSIAPAATKEPALPSPHAQAADVVEIAGVWADDRSLRVELAIANGHHIQANPTARGLIATSVTVRDLEASVSYPVGIPQTFPFADSPANVYSGHVTILVTFAKPVTDAPVVALTYQACTDQACLPPITKHLQFKRS